MQQAIAAGTGPVRLPAGDGSRHGEEKVEWSGEECMEGHLHHEVADTGGRGCCAGMGGAADLAPDSTFLLHGYGLQRPAQMPFNLAAGNEVLIE